MSYPDFVCMGFQKCGTTTLFEIMRQHPDVALTRDVKEPMYYRVPFASTFGMHGFFYRWRYFAHVPKGDPRMKGEINAGLTFTHCAKKFSKDNAPGVKMIFMVRNPADRCYSAYKYFLARGFISVKDVEYDLKYGHAKGFDHYVHRILDDPKEERRIMKKRLHYLVLSQSNYATCIEEYLKKYPKKDMHFIVFEEFIQDQHASCLDLYQFLGLADYETINYNVKANEGNARAVSGKKVLKLKIVKAFRYGFEEFANLRHWGPKLYRRYERYYRKVKKKSMVKDTDKSRMLPETRAYLMRYYDDEICHLEKIMGRDLHEIWK